MDRETDDTLSSRSGSKTRLIALLILAVLIWGAVLAVGAYRFNHDPRRAAVVLACVLGFLAFWGLLLWNRARTKGS